MTRRRETTEEIIDKIDKIDALAEQEWEARINECGHIARECRKEITKLKRKLKRRRLA